MNNPSLSRLTYLCTIIPDKLRALTEADWTTRTAPEKWSRKEILGHLIDSATNNHQRFVRAQFDDRPLITYHADEWVAASRYQAMPVSHLVAFWQMYNMHIAELIRQIPADMMARECHTGDEAPHTLVWIFDDYVVHLEHHLREVIHYE